MFSCKPLPCACFVLCASFVLTRMSFLVNLAVGREWCAGEPWTLLAVQTRFISRQWQDGLNSSGPRLSSWPGQILVVASNGVSSVCAAFFRSMRPKNGRNADRRVSAAWIYRLWRKRPSAGEQFTLPSLQMRQNLLKPLRKVQQGWKQQQKPLV